MTATLSILPGNASHRGRRAEQQDCLGFSRFDDDALIAHGGLLAVIADGMGGFNGGARASREAVAAMRAGYQSKAPWEPIPEALLRALGRANRAVCDLAAEIGSEGRCGTTLVATVIHGCALYWVSVGDSRLYLLRAGELLRLTDSHTRERQLTAEVEAGRMTRAELITDPERHALSSWLGLRDLPEICINQAPSPLIAGDRLLLCTDGLFNSLDDDEIAPRLAADDPHQAAEALVEAALAKANPQQDNVTVIVLEAAD